MTDTDGPRRVYRHAELVRLIAPRSVALVGATSNPGSFAARTQNNLRAFGGPVYLVNAKYDEIDGQPCFASIAALPQVPDCAVIAVAREGVQAVAEECAAVGVGAAIVYAAGYTETGRPELVAMQQRLGALARETGLKIAGPNCLGVVNHLRRLAMVFTKDYDFSPPGAAAVGLICQSGAMANGLNEALRLGARFSHMLTVGNSCDVDVADYVSYLAEDPGCSAIACLFESVPSPQRLFEAADLAWAADKPLVVFKLGVTGEGAAAAMSHSGMLSGSAEAYAAAFERAGAVVASSLQGFIETASFFAKAPRPTAKGVAVVTASGGLGVLAADVAERHGVQMPQPQAETLARLKAIVPEYGAARNPCDVTAQVIREPQMMDDCVETLFADPAYGALVHPLPNSRPGGQEVLFRMRDVAARHGKPLVVAWVGNWLQGPDSDRLEADPGVTLFRSIDNSFSTLAAWIRRGAKRDAWLAEAGREPERRSPPAAAEAAAKLLAAAAGRVLTEREAKAVLATYGVPVTPERLARSADEAADAARALGFPVALKLESPDLPHKTEAGVIRLGVRDEDEARAAFEAIMAKAGAVSPAPRVHGVLVQPMAAPGVEVIVGARVDPLFGPLVVVGLGGALVELLKDTAVALAPVDARRARAMLAGLKGRALLEGFRGATPADQARLADVICRLSEFAADQKDRIAELDVNPLICAGEAITAVDALIVKA